MTAVEKRLTDFIGLSELSMEFGMADFEIKRSPIKRSSNEKTRELRHRYATALANGSKGQICIAMLGLFDSCLFLFETKLLLQ